MEGLASYRCRIDKAPLLAFQDREAMVSCQFLPPPPQLTIIAGERKIQIALENIADVKVKASTGKMRLQLNEGGAPSVWVLGLLGNDVAVRVKELAKAIKNPDSAASKAPSSQQAAGGMDVMGALRSNSRAAREGKKLAAASKLEDIKKWVLQHDKGVKQSYDAAVASGHITEAEFWESRTPLLLSIQSKLDDKVALANAMPRFEERVNEQGKTLSTQIEITPEFEAHTLAMEPRVHRAFNELVGNGTMTREEFWVKYLRSKRYHAKRKAAAAGSATADELNLAKYGPPAIEERRGSARDEKGRIKRKHLTGVTEAVNLLDTAEDNLRGAQWRGPVVANPSTQPAAAQDGTNGTAKRQKTPHLEHFASHYGLKERSTVYDDAVDMAYEPPKELASLDPAALTKPGGREAARHALEDIRQRYESLKASAAATEHLMSEFNAYGSMVLHEYREPFKGASPELQEELEDLRAREPPPGVVLALEGSQFAIAGAQSRAPQAAGEGPVVEVATGSHPLKHYEDNWRCLHSFSEQFKKQDAQGKRTSKGFLVHMPKSMREMMLTQHRVNTELLHMFWKIKKSKLSEARKERLNALEQRLESQRQLLRQERRNAVPLAEDIRTPVQQLLYAMQRPIDAALASLAGTP